MAPVEPLAPEALCTGCDPATLPFETTDDLEVFEGIIAQDRAMSAVRFGVDIRRPGYNIFVLGPSGTGKRTIVEGFLAEHAARMPLPDDWCYVHNFEEPYAPRALALPCGRAVSFRMAMDQLVSELRAAIPAAFESEDYQERRKLLEDRFSEEHQRAFDELQKDARAHDISIIRGPQGFIFAPTRNGEIIKPEVFQKLTEAEQDRYREEVERLQERLEEIMRQAPAWQKDLRQKLRALNAETTERVARILIDGVRKDFEDLPEVIHHLHRVQEDVVANAFDFLRAAADLPPGLQGAGSQHVQSLVGGTNEMIGGDEPASFRRYQVNVLVHNVGDAIGQSLGAPVVIEDAPALGNLLGRIEYGQRLGALVTDFTLIKPGALHRANGGFLVVDARKLLMQPLAWEELKRAITAREIRIETLAQLAGLISTVSLEPQPIPLDVKVVLVGEPLLYYLLAAHDPDFAELFKVQAEFGDRVERTTENVELYARLIATLARREDLAPLGRDAVASLIDQGARLTGDSERLSTRFSLILDLLREADYWARKDGEGPIRAAHVRRAIDAQIHRADRIREQMHEQITRGTVMIDTAGERIGQVNGLAVLQTGTFAFGKPTRITARVRLGRGEIVDIERRVELGGPLHAKGVLILTAYLGAKFGQSRPLALSASLVFEQSYGGVDGDSASSTELYALLSALAEVPIRQGLAVTGSVNQHGEVQAIGGVNEKIEGFFDICRARGLTGEQGVLVPAANVPHLMLRADVVEACGKGKFKVYPIRSIDEGIEILTGIEAGTADADGVFPEGTINARVASRLDAFAASARRFARPNEIGSGVDGSGDAETDDEGGRADREADRS